MKAAVFTKYGSPDVLEVREVAKPDPKDDEVLVKVHAASLNDWDWGALHGIPFVNRWIFGLFKPKKQILGSDIAGRVEAVGKNVHRFRAGDAVFGDLSGSWGGFAEYVCAPETALVLKPSDMTFEQAAAFPQAGLLALQGLRDIARIRSGQRLLINGAGGGAGTFAIQIAKSCGVEITGVDSAEKLPMLRSMGVKHVIDYASQDFTKSGERYDVILDVKASRPILKCVSALRAGGVYVILGGEMARLIQALLAGPFIAMASKKKVSLVMLRLNKGLDQLMELFDSRSVAPVIDGPYPLRDVADAFRRFGRGQHQGKIVITIDPPRQAFERGSA